MMSHTERDFERPPPPSDDSSAGSAGGVAKSEFDKAFADLPGAMPARRPCQRNRMYLPEVMMPPSGVWSS